MIVLPFELLALIIIKAVVKLRKVLFVSMLRRADVSALTTILQVCNEWRSIVSRRKWIQRKIRRQLLEQESITLPLDLIKAMSMFREAESNIDIEPKEANRHVVCRTVFFAARVEEVSECCQMSPFTNETLPVELLEIVLIKAVEKLHKVLFVSVLRRADVLALTTILQVCNEWRSIVSRRKWIQNQIRRRLFRQKSITLPLDLIKAMSMFREAESNIDIEPETANCWVMISVACVCRRWRSIVARCNRASRKRVERLFLYTSQREDFERHLRTVKNIMEPDCGLLDELIRLDIISVDDAEEIRLLKNVFKQNLIIVQKAVLGKSANQLRLFLTALNKTHQQHVSNWITYYESDAAQAGDHWPLDKHQLSVINSNLPKLVNLLSVDDDLLNLMNSCNCWSATQINKIRETLTNRDRNNKLLEILKRGSISQFNNFIRCLSQKQHNLIRLLRGVGNPLGEDPKPLDDKVLTEMRTHLIALTKDIVLDERLLSEMLCHREITEGQRKNIEAAVDHYRRIKDVLQSISDKSEGVLDSIKSSICPVETNLHVEQSVSDDAVAMPSRPVDRRRNQRSLVKAMQRPKKGGEQPLVGVKQEESNDQQLLTASRKSDRKKDKDQRLQNASKEGKHGNSRNLARNLKVDKSQSYLQMSFESIAKDRQLIDERPVDIMKGKSGTSLQTQQQQQGVLKKPHCELSSRAHGVNRTCKEALRVHRQGLNDLADEDDLFLDHVTARVDAAVCLSETQKELIKGHKRCRQRMDTLVTCVEFGNEEAFSALWEALKSFGTKAKEEMAKKLDDKVLSEMRTHLTALTKDIVLDERLLSEMLSHREITEGQRKNIEAAVDHYKRIIILLKIISRESVGVLDQSACRTIR